MGITSQKIKKDKKKSISQKTRGLPMDNSWWQRIYFQFLWCNGIIDRCFALQKVQPSANKNKWTYKVLSRLDCKVAMHTFHWVKMSCIYYPSCQMDLMYTDLVSIMLQYLIDTVHQVKMSSYTLSISFTRVNWVHGYCQLVYIRSSSLILSITVLNMSS